MIIKFFFLILIIFKICDCFKHNYFCVLNDYKNLICKKEQCGENICSKDKESCRSLCEYVTEQFDQHMKERNSVWLPSYIENKTQRYTVLSNSL